MSAVAWPEILNCWKPRTIARGAGVSVNTINNWKAGRNFPTARRAVRGLATFLGVSEPSIRIGVRLYRERRAA